MAHCFEIQDLNAVELGKVLLPDTLHLSTLSFSYFAKKSLWKIHISAVKTCTKTLTVLNLDLLCVGLSYKISMRSTEVCGYAAWPNVESLKDVQLVPTFSLGSLSLVFLSALNSLDESISLLRLNIKPVLDPVRHQAVKSLHSRASHLVILQRVKQFSNPAKRETNNFCLPHKHGSSCWLFSFFLFTSFHISFWIPQSV